MAEEKEEEEVAKEAIPEATEAEETAEQKHWRLRAEASLIERKAILERNGLKFEDHTPAEGVEIVRRCCGK